MATVRYLVNDVAACTDFYVGALGFALIQAYGPNMAILTRGDLSLWIAGPGASAARPMLDGAKPVPGGWSRFVIETGDLDGMIADVGARNARFLNEIVSGPGGRQILIEDPSGNVVELFEPG